MRIVSAVVAKRNARPPSSPTLTTSPTQEPGGVLSSLYYSKLRNGIRNYLGGNLSSFCVCHHHHLQGRLANRKQHAERICLRPGTTKLTGTAGQPRWPRSSGVHGPRPPPRTPAPDEGCQTLTWVYSSLCWQLFLDQVSEGRIAGWTGKLTVGVGF